MSRSVSVPAVLGDVQGLFRLGLAALVALSMLTMSVAAGLPVSNAHAQDSQPGTAAYAPETSLFFASVELDQDSNQWSLAAELSERSGVTGLLSEDDIAELEDGLAQIEDVVNGEAGLVLTTLPISDDENVGDLVDDASGVALDPAAVAEGDVPEGWALVVQPSDPQALYDLLRDSVLGADDVAVSDSSDATPTTDATDYEGYAIEYVEPVDEFGTGSAIALVDDVVVIATQPADIEPIIDTATGAVAPLSDLAQFTDLRGRVEAEVLSFGFVNGPEIIAGVEAQDPESLAEVPDDFLASLDAYSAFAFWADEPGFRLDTLAIPAEGRELPTVETLDPTFTENIDGNSLVYAGGTNIGQNPALNAIALVFAQELVGIDAGATPVAAQDPEAYADEVFAEAEAQLGFNIKTDFLDNMVGEWGVAMSADDLISAEPVVNGVFASNVEDATAVTDVVDQMSAIAESGAGEDFEVSSRDVDGSSITTVDVGDAGLPLVIEFGVVGDQFLIGVNEGIDSFVNGPDTALADNETFTATLDALPAEFSSVSFINLELAIPLIEETATALDSSASVPDADPACEEFATQEEAQEAYDADNFENFALDQDFDGTACEDFFGQDTASPEASPSVSSTLSVRSIGTVAFQADGASATSTIVLIGE